MTNDELSEAMRGLLMEAHAKVNALPNGSVKLAANRLLWTVHQALKAFHDYLVSRGEIQPLSGGDPNKTPPP